MISKNDCFQNLWIFKCNDSINYIIFFFKFWFVLWATKQFQGSWKSVKSYFQFHGNVSRAAESVTFSGDDDFDCDFSFRNFSTFNTDSGNPKRPDSTNSDFNRNSYTKLSKISQVANYDSLALKILRIVTLIFMFSIILRALYVLLTQFFSSYLDIFDIVLLKVYSYLKIKMWFQSKFITDNSLIKISKITTCCTT